MGAKEASVDISRMQDISRINDDPIKCRINRVRPFKQGIAAVCIFSRWRTKLFHVAIQGNFVVGCIIAAYSFVAGRSMPIERSSRIGAIEQIDYSSKNFWIGRIIVRDSL